MLLEKAELLWLIPLARGRGLVGLVVAAVNSFPRGWGMDSRPMGLALLILFFFFSEHKYSARWTKVMGTAEWKASRTRRW